MLSTVTVTVAAGTSTTINNTEECSFNSHHHRALDLFFSTMRHFVSPEGVADYILGRNNFNSKTQFNRNTSKHAVKTRKLHGMLQLTSFRVMVAALIEGGEGPCESRRCCTEIFETDLVKLNRTNHIERVSTDLYVQ